MWSLYALDAKVINMSEKNLQMLSGMLSGTLLAMATIVLTYSTFVGEPTFVSERFQNPWRRMIDGGFACVSAVLTIQSFHKVAAIRAAKAKE